MSTSSQYSNVQETRDCENKLQPSNISNLDNDIPTINVRSVSRSSSFVSSSTGSASSYAMARTTWTKGEIMNKTGAEEIGSRDRNATYKEYSNPCESSCSKPNAICGDFCTKSGCQCNALYIFSDDGKCILPDDCPGGSPCSHNETFLFCNARCPTDYYPVNDNLERIACDPTYPCLGGCACKANYKRKSLEDDRCILASDCLPVNCTRQNEEWNPCPQPCSEKCTDLNTDASECGQSTLYCDPKCFCKEGYRRNDKDICGAVADCSTEDSEF